MMSLGKIVNSRIYFMAHNASFLGPGRIDHQAGQSNPVPFRMQRLSDSTKKSCSQQSHYIAAKGDVD